MAISWLSKKQTIFSQLTTEDEFVAVLFAIRKSIWSKSIIMDLKFHSSCRTGHIDLSTINMKVTDLSEDEIKSEKSKHMNITYYLVRDDVKKKKVKRFAEMQFYAKRFSVNRVSLKCARQ